MNSKEQSVIETMPESKYSAGMRRVELLDTRQKVAIETMLFYPCDAAEQQHELGPYIGSWAENAELSNGRHPLVIISHGSGGSPITHHQLASGLARNGFVVCVPEHPFNNRRDNSGEGSAQLFEARCHQIGMCIDQLAQLPFLQDRVLTERVSYVGHSIGANVGMILIGARALEVDQHRKVFGMMYHEKADSYENVQLATEPRIAAAVLFALVPTWFQHPGALQQVRAKVLIQNGAQDPFIPCTVDQTLVNTESCSAEVVQEVLSYAGHFSFLSPVRPEFVSRMGLVATDPPGFDRAKFQLDLIKRLTELFLGAL